MINPGSLPVEGAREELAAAALDVFLAQARERGARFAGDPVRDPAADRDGRYGWDLPMADGSVTRLLMPGAELTRIQGLGASAPVVLYVCGGAWWWSSAVGLVASPARWSFSPRSTS